MPYRKNPLISVIIANRNHGNHLGPCLESVFRSDYPSFEVIVVDDHSRELRRMGMRVGGGIPHGDCSER